MTILAKTTLKKRIHNHAFIMVLVCCTLFFAGFSQGYAGQKEDRAKQLQLEATKLQLKGDLENALIKYKESQELVPNPRLEGIVSRLEKRVQNAQNSAANQVAKPTNSNETAAPSVAASTTPGEPDTAETTGQPVNQYEESTIPSASSLKKYVPKDEQEQRICTYLDEQLSYFPKNKDGSSMVQVQYTIEKTASDSYKVLFDTFVISFYGTVLNMAPIQLEVTTQEDLLALSAQLPSQLSFGDDQKGVDLGFTKQHITAQWDEKMKVYKGADIAFSTVAIQDKSGHLSMVIGSVKSTNALKTTPENNWVNVFSTTLEDITVEGKKGAGGKAHVDSVSWDNEVRGRDLSSYMEKIHKNVGYINSLVAVDTPQEAIHPEEFAVFDILIELWTKTTGLIQVHGLNYTDGDIRLELDAIEGRSSAEKDPANKEIGSEAVFAVQGLRITEKETIKRLNLDSFTISSTGNLHKIPGQLFEQTGVLASTVLQAENKQQYFPQIKEQVSAFLALFASLSINTQLDNITVTPADPNGTVHFDSLTIKNSLDTTPGSGGLLSLLYSLSGLKVNIETGFSFPEAVNISLELSNIPSLIQLIASTEGMPLDTLKTELPNLFLQSIMSSKLTLKVIDSFIAFPQSRFGIEGTSTVDQASQFFSANSFQAAMVNPEDFLKNIEAINAVIPGIGQAMGTYTALANRITADDGITTDILKIETTQEGKILSNGKDVTSMLLGGQ